MKNTIEIISKLSDALKSKGFNDNDILVIGNELSKLFSDYKLSGNRMRNDSIGDRQYRVRYKIKEKYGCYVSHFELIHASKAENAKKIIRDKYPECRVTSAIWLP